MVEILWFRADLRLADQPALAAAAAAGPVLPVVLLAPAGPRPPGGAARWWQARSLAALDASIRARGGPGLYLLDGGVEALAALAAQTGARAIHAMPQADPGWAADEAALGSLLQLHGRDTLHPLDEVRTRSGGPFRVFTPFWRAQLALGDPPPPAPVPARIAFAPHPPGGLALPRFEPRWASGLAAAGWQPGEAGATAQLAAFLPHVAAYGARRDFPAEPATSRLSPHLAFGEISPATIWHAATDAAGAAAQPFTRQLAWRDFARALVRLYPHSATRAHRPAFERMAWTDVTRAPGRDWLAAWQRGETGYPLVDAGMRELWQTGWMHNRVRMVVASFLTKHLGIDWRRGEQWFWDCLLDADLPNNAMGWQWVMGSGVDAQPYYRIFAPTAQAEKFDAAAYVRRFAPHFRGLAPERPIVDHATARAAALARHAALREEAT